MFLLDTNVVSDLRLPHRLPARAVQWFGAVPAASLYVSAITIFEIQHGIVDLRRRDTARANHLQRWFETAVLTAFVGRILTLDTDAALRGAELHAGRSRIVADRLIAAIALARGMTVVTRNVRDFVGTGAKVLDPSRV